MKLFLLAAITALLFACNSSGNTSTGKKDSTAAVSEAAATVDTSGFVALFDGKTTKGWHKYGGGPVGSAWKIENGKLSLDTSKKYAKITVEKVDVKPVEGGYVISHKDFGNSHINLKIKGGKLSPEAFNQDVEITKEKVDTKIADAGNIVTDEEFDNFHLKLEWKISPKGNSGILLFVHEDTLKFKEPYMTGPEMQVLDNEGHPDGKLFRHRAGDLYDLIMSSKEMAKPVGEWNLAEVISNNDKLELKLNGTTVVTTTMWDDNWTNMVAKSKFKEWPGFGTFKKGRICLQDHDNAVSFRNIMIKKL